MKQTEELTPYEIALQKALYENKSMLSDKELIMLILSDRKCGEQKAAQLLDCTKEVSNLGTFSLNEICQTTGATKPQAAALFAAAVLAQRIKITSCPEVETIRTNKDVEKIFRNALGASPTEDFWALYLTGTNKVIEKTRISIGGRSTIGIDIKVILKRGIELLCASIIVAHNHPTGDTAPSDEDRKLTKALFEAAKSVDIHLLDHLIIGKNDAYSFLERGIMPKE